MQSIRGVRATPGRVRNGRFVPTAKPVKRRKAKAKKRPARKRKAVRANVKRKRKPAKRKGRR